MADSKQECFISGKKYGSRLESRVLEEKIQDAVDQGYRHIEIEAFGQHGIGGRLWGAKEETVRIEIKGYPGQRLGSMGFPNTRITIHGPASDDTGWLNAGAEIVIHGHAANGTANAMAQGKVCVAGNIGARGMTMTKQNPRFAAPELWVLGSAGDYFGEFMAGGIAVICGHEAQTPDNILGYRPFVGMVGGRVFFRGPHKGYSLTDAKIVPIGEADREWLLKNLKIFLEKINRAELFGQMSDPSDWQLLVARTPQEKAAKARPTMAAFKETVWDAELGEGGIIGDLTAMDRSAIPLITTGDLRRFVPVWENDRYMAPCEATCPTGIPVQERWGLVREGRMDEAVDLALSYTPFPATICGYLCPNPCMQACTRQSAAMLPVDISKLGKASIDAKVPELPPASGEKVAVVGGGPAGISVAWQLRLQGHAAVVFDNAPSLGGKISSAIPGTRIPEQVVTGELERVGRVIDHVHLKQKLSREEVERMTSDYAFVVIAAGAQKPRRLPVPGGERLVTALDFLSEAKTGKPEVGRRVVIIGAGNVGCDVAAEAHRLGAGEITLIDIQEPLSFGKEREAAEAVGAKFVWPCFTKEITGEGVLLTDGRFLPADSVFISIGDAPDLDFLPENVATDRGFVTVDAQYRTSNPKIFAIGDVVRPGLLTDAIGAGRKAAGTIIDLIAGREPVGDARTMIDKHRINLAYFDPRVIAFDDTDHCGSQCASCGRCRDCGTCVAVCPETAISRVETEKGGYEYRVDENRCIGCGFCADTCPCGIWNLVENEPV